MRKRRDGQSDLVLFENPWLPRLGTEAHGAENRDRDSQATLTELLVLRLGALERLLESLWYLTHLESVWLSSMYKSNAE